MRICAREHGGCLGRFLVYVVAKRALTDTCVCVTLIVCVYSNVSGAHVVARIFARARTRLRVVVVNACACKRAYTSVRFIVVRVTSTEQARARARARNGSPFLLRSSVLLSFARRG